MLVMPQPRSTPPIFSGTNLRNRVRECVSVCMCLELTCAVLMPVRAWNGMSSNAHRHAHTHAHAAHTPTLRYTNHPSPHAHPHTQTHRHRHTRAHTAAHTHTHHFSLFPSLRAVLSSRWSKCVWETSTASMRGSSSTLHGGGRYRTLPN